MGFPSASAPPAPPPPPPAAAPATYANAGVQSSAQGAQRRMKAAAGFGADNTIFTGAQGAATPPTAKQALLGS